MFILQKWSEKLARSVVLNLTPKKVLRAVLREGASYRPQVAWLPLVENRGKGHVLPQDFDEDGGSVISWR